MDYKESWPPKSAHQALLSSPSGRRKYEDHHISGENSPIKRSTTPGLLDRLRLARKNQDHFDNVGQKQGEDEDEDEETLRLELAAIEARLKLRRLQNKSKRDTAQSSVTLGGSGAALAPPSQVQVTLSPTRRSQTTVEPKSPGRVVLGIDKGMRAADISLRRARSTAGSPTKERRALHVSGRPISRSSTVSSASSNRPHLVAEKKSFSERMLEGREHGRRQFEKRDAIQRERLKSFQIDHSELEHFKAAAGAQKGLSGQHDAQKLPERTAVNDEQRRGILSQDLDVSLEDGEGDANLFEGFSELHLVSRILPHTFLKRTLPSEQFKIYKVPDLLREVKSPAFELPDEVGDFVVFGIVASKSLPLDQKSKVDSSIKYSDEWQTKWEDGSQNRKKFIALTITDLKWTVDLFLFDTAMPRYHRLNVGTVVAILNPAIMPPKRGKEDTGAFSLSLHNGDDTVLEIGMSKDLGFCNAKKSDGKECGSWVDASKSEICEWHLNAQVAKTQASRMGVNAGANGFGSTGSHGKHGAFNNRRGGGLRRGNGLLPAQQGRGFDRATGTHYFIATTNSGTNERTRGSTHRAGTSAAMMSDSDTDDPFIAEGKLSRGREARLQKRMADQEKERQIAKSLATLGHGRDAGAEYMRKRASVKLPTATCDQSRHPNLGAQTAATEVSGIQGSQTISTKLSELRAQIGRKRAAQDVQLSPVRKKTRFMTSTGVKEAGRDSLGPRSAYLGKLPGSNISDDDDDLDIE